MASTFDRTTLHKYLATSFLFVSGACALVYELVWSKYLGNVLGNSGQAHAVVLATFMGGLAFGAYLFGRTSDRVKVPLRLYGYLELGIGIYALLFYPVLGMLGKVYLAIAPSMPESTRLIAKMLLAGAAILPPTILMGGTLPPLVRHFTSQLSGLRRELARLYAVNSLGAALGVFIAGVHLVPDFGLATSARIAAALNIFIALSAIALSRSPAPVSSTSKDEEVEEPAYPLRAVKIALWGSALSGFSAMVMQVSWIRLLALVMGASTYAFTLILTAFILGIGLGSFWLAQRKTGDTLRLFGWLQAGIALAVCVALPLYIRMPLWLWRISDLLSHSAESWPVYQALSFGLCCIVLIVPTALMGASFPAVARVATANVSEMGRKLGGVYLWNTMGTVLGSLCGGLLFMPAIRMEGAFAIGVGVNILAAALALSVSAGDTASKKPLDRVRPLAPVGVALAAAVLFFAGSAGWSTSVANAGAFRDNGKAPPSFEAYQAWLDTTYTNTFYQDDTFATVVVGKVHPEGTQFLRINGKVDASDGGDMDTQMLVGSIGPLLSKRQVKNVLVVGLGSGVTVGSLLAHPGVEHVDVVEISPGVVSGAKFFAHVNRNALTDPRVKVHIDDARTFMLLQGKKYDLIISEPSNPWVAGIAGLFTREFFQLAKDHLEPDGLLVQWIHLYEISDQLVKLVIRTMRETFPHGNSWLGRLDVVMVAGAQDVSPDPAVIAERLKIPSVAEDLERMKAHKLVPFLALQVHSDQGQLEFAGQGPINTEDDNLLEYAAPIAFYLRHPTVLIRDERRAADGGPRLAISQYLKAHPPTPEDLDDIHAAVLSAGSPDDPLVRAAAEKWVQLAPDSEKARRALGIAALAQNDFLAADQMLGAPKMDSRDPDLVAAWIRLSAWKLQWRHGTWGAIDVPDVRNLLVENLKATPRHPGLMGAALKYCRGEPLEKCLGAQVRFVNGPQ